MNLYFVVSPDGRYNHVVLAPTADKANDCYRRIVKKEPKVELTKRVSQGKYLVGMTYLFDDYS